MDNFKINITGPANNYRIIRRSKMINALFYLLLTGITWLGLFITIQIICISFLDKSNIVNDLSGKTSISRYYASDVLSLPRNMIIFIVLIGSLCFIIFHNTLIEPNEDQLIFLNSTKYGYIVVQHSPKSLWLARADSFFRVKRHQNWQTVLRYKRENTLYHTELTIDFIINPERIIQQEVAIFMPGQRSYKLVINDYLERIAEITPEGYVSFPDVTLQDNPFGLDDFTVTRIQTLKVIHAYYC